MVYSVLSKLDILREDCFCKNGEILMHRFEGECLCGEVKYCIDGEPTGFFHCHCERCRRVSGTGHASNLRVVSDGVNWLKGESLILLQWESVVLLKGE